jgi:hypothetical protein
VDSLLENTQGTLAEGVRLFGWHHNQIRLGGGCFYDCGAHGLVGGCPVAGSIEVNVQVARPVFGSSTVDLLIARNELQIRRVGKRVLVTGDSLAKFAEGE